MSLIIRIPGDVQMKTQVIGNQRQEMQAQNPFAPGYRLSVLVESEDYDFKYFRGEIQTIHGDTVTFLVHPENDETAYVVRFDLDDVVTYTVL
jgi:hypothetical protein